ncbi:MAG TPA: MBOAT family O-acyltransferase [Bacteroidia bacterium]|nr:MBOAT family O-acyltransferase [Bacteroidia bacterium]
MILPIGISFYTFETLTYVVDVYRRVHIPLKKFWDYLLYILFFPKLIAGPIVRYHEISDQLTNRNETIDNKINGLFRFIIGLSKKVLIANVLAEQADKIFDLSLADITTNHAWSGALLYTFQIYFDFSGYSDMAIGLALLFGFRLPENFNNPYISQSITEFWRRWHMTLGNWMKNYLYIPLGGNKVKSKSRLYFNLSLVFIISGFWHGAAWTFIIWGAYHGFFLIIERLFLLRFYKKAGKLISTLLTFLFVVIGWVFFRAENFGQAVLFIKKMFQFRFSGQLVFLFEEKLIWIFCIAIASCFIWTSTSAQKFQQKLILDSPGLLNTFFKSIVGIVLSVICLGSVVGSNFNPFIYFRF